ncbi:MAG TPA: hypothetical protein VGK54_19700 [Chloroflexota bacterium]
MADQDEPRRSARGQSNDFVFRIPRPDPETLDWLLDLLPGRALMRVLSHPPDEFRQHALAARKERLLAVRSMLDALIDETDRPPGRSPARQVPIEE